MTPFLCGNLNIHSRVFLSGKSKRIKEVKNCKRS